MKFIFDKNIPATVLPELQHYLLPLEWLIPGWCGEVLINWSHQEDEDNAAIAAEVNYEYRWARLTFYPCFHSQREEAKREQVVHDLLHAFVGVLSDYARETIKLLTPDDELARDIALAELRVRNESYVQDMAICLVKHLNEAQR